MLDFDLMLAAGALERARQALEESQMGLANAVTDEWTGASAETAREQVHAAFAEGASVQAFLDDASQAFRVALVEIALLRASEGG